MSLSRKCREVIPFLDYALQPIANIHSGVCYGYEALLRGIADSAFQDASALMDQALADGCLADLHQVLLGMALDRFAQLPAPATKRLFFNIDARLLASSDHLQVEVLPALLKLCKLPTECLTFEISEKHRFDFTSDVLQSLKKMQKQGIRIAIDDFGTGFAGFELHYHLEPDFIKIDQFFISSIYEKRKKKLFVANMVNMAHLAGSIVIAEGVESELELKACRELGCDLLQGCFVAPAQTDLRRLRDVYPQIPAIASLESRSPSSLRTLARDRIKAIPPIRLDQQLVDIFDIFRNHTEQTYFPVVNNTDEPVGIIRESRIKEFTYSLYGKELLRNHAYKKEIRDVIDHLPVADINTPMEKILQMFSMNEDIEGIIIVEKMRYAGMLGANSLLQQLHEIHLSSALDQNPLTKLPGNQRIFEHLSLVLAVPDQNYAFVYLDFDHFKPFNDRFGFRQGDRIILLFSDLLKRMQSETGDFIAHIGGDDFFLSRDMAASMRPIREDVHKLISAFASAAESFYPPEDIARGFMQGKDREGNPRDFALITISAAIVVKTVGSMITSPEALSSLIANLKKEAKADPEHISEIALPSVP